MAFVKIPESTIQVKLVELTDNCIDKIADAVVRELTNRKTENCSERLNNCEWSVDERCIGCNHYKLTCDLFSEICHYEPKDEPQINCDTCRFEDYCPSEEPCNSCFVDNSRWQPKDEPQIERSE